MICGRFPRRILAKSGIIFRSCSSNPIRESFKEKISSGPDLSSFISSSRSKQLNELLDLDPSEPFVAKRRREEEKVPYIDPSLLDGNKEKVFIETYGCQMNVNDTQIVAKILEDHNYVISKDEKDCEIVFLMTCAIRESAERKVWTRLGQVTRLKSESESRKRVKQVGLLGCMAERLRRKVIEKEKLVDIVAGPDSYKDLPKLLAINRSTGQHAINVLLSFDETYADVIPTHGVNSVNSSSPVTAFISIMRGCDNMCTYCIVPFVRGKERSREIDSILKEVQLSSLNGVKEITLLGQNVNSYRDMSPGSDQSTSGQEVRMAPGFKTVYKPKVGGRRFDELVRKVASIDSEIRIRFTSPHPKDFSEELIDVIREHDNVCKCIHLPAQSGSNSVLENMKRGYRRESYLDLVHKIRSKIPNISITSDFIAGFCGETEEDHQLTLDLINQVKYSFIYTFPYSMRDKTKAFHHLNDDVPLHVKKRRAEDIATLFRKHALQMNQGLVHTHQLVLIEKTSKRSDQHFVGRCDNNVKTIFPAIPLPDINGHLRIPSPGDYVAVLITSATSQTLQAHPLKLTTLVDYYKNTCE